MEAPPSCTWLFGRGASIANGLPWIVPEEWKRDLAEGRVSRDDHIRMIVDTIRAKMEKPSVDGKAYREFLDFIVERTVEDGHHRLLTTNWDHLLQREMSAWMSANGWVRAPGVFSTYSMIYHLNGSTEPGEFQNRSKIMLENDSAAVRRRTFEANKAYEHLLWSSLIVIVGMSFECDIDKGLLGALRYHEDNMPIGAARFVVVDPSQKVLDDTFTKLASCFPRAGGIQVRKGFREWIGDGMPELVGSIFNE